MKLLAIIKKEIVLTIAFVLAVISLFLIPPTRAYLDYIDYRTLAILFCMMVVMAGLQKLNVFQQIGERLIQIAPNSKVISLTLILLCFVFSMFITNDVALLTFVPFSIIVLHEANLDHELILVITLETVAANLGSMLMPMGNPQNLYLYSLAGISLPSFVMLMLPYALVSLVLILALNQIFISKVPVKLTTHHEIRHTKKAKIQLVIYLLLFILSLLVVAHVIDYRIAFCVVLIVTLIMDTRTVFQVDYSLILTFVFLFVFIGNIKQIDVVSQTLSTLVKGHEVITSVVSSQIISNVPAAILLSRFTDRTTDLIIGTNLGGLGTLIASMASLISFKLYGVTQDANKGKYIAVFTLVNLGLLIILFVFHYILMRI